MPVPAGLIMAYAGLNRSDGSGTPVKFWRILIERHGLYQRDLSGVNKKLIPFLNKKQSFVKNNCL